MKWKFLIKYALNSDLKAESDMFQEAILFFFFS
jgi:hypothetical protein